MATLDCPRCAAQLLPPTLLEHQYRCPVHGEVAGVVPAIPFGGPDVAALARRSDVPIWFPQPMPDGWLFTGLRWAQTPRRRATGVAIGISGKGLAEGPTDVVIVAERPGCGMGAGFAGLQEPDPGSECFAHPAAARVHTGHRSTGMWSVATSADRVAYVGEAEGNWLWIIGWPESAWGLLADGLQLSDGRADASYRQFAVGALNPRLLRAE